LADEFYLWGFSRRLACKLVASNPPREVRRDFASLQKIKPLEGAVIFLAERGGFEPPVGYEPTHAFQACDLNHSSISPFWLAFLNQAADYSKPALIELLLAAQVLLGSLR
jgi:hypothetical protein